MKKVTSGIAILLFAPLCISATATYALNLDRDSVKKAKVKVEFPKKPEIWEIYDNLNPEQYKPQADIPDFPQKKTHDETKPVSFLGFVGPYATDEVVGDGVKLLENSLTISTEGNWTVLGLVRNELTENVGQVEIVATLLAEDGKVLEKVKGEVLVRGIRPGEPAPFQIKSTSPIQRVNKVEWSISTKDTTSKVSREQNIGVYYEFEYGQSDYKGLPRKHKDYPYEMATGFNNLGAEVKKEKLVAAWLTPEGKVFHLEQASLDPIFDHGVEKGGAANFTQIVVSDPQVAPYLSNYPYMLWAVGE